MSKMERVVQLVRAIEAGREAEQELKQLIGDNGGNKQLVFGGGTVLPFTDKKTKSRPPRTGPRATPRAASELRSDIQKFLRQNQEGFTRTELASKVRTGDRQLFEALRELKRLKLVYTKQERRHDRGGPSTYWYARPLEALNGTAQHASA